MEQKMCRQTIGQYDQHVLH